ERLTLAVLFDHRQIANVHALEGGKASPTAFALPPPPDRRAVLGRAAVLYLAVFMSTEGTAQGLTFVDREAGAERADPLADRLLDRAIIVGAVLLEPIEDVGDHVGDVAEFIFTEAAGGPGWRAGGGAAGVDRRLRIERHAVLVAGDAGMLEALVSVGAGHAERAEV